MQQGKIVVTVSTEPWYPIENCEFHVTASKGKLKHSLCFWGEVNDWKDFGNQLLKFPQNTKSRLRLELGSSTEQLTLQAYCYDENGHAAIAVTMSENEDEPHFCRVQFSLLAEVASINELGSLLLAWEVKNGSQMIWEAQTS